MRVILISHIDLLECQVLWLQHHPAKPPVILEGLRVKVYKLAMPKSKVTPLEGTLMEIEETNHSSFFEKHPVMCGTLTFFWRVRRLPWKWIIALISIGWKWVGDALFFVQIISEASFASGFLAEPSFHQILLRRWVVVRAIVTCRYAEVDGLWTLSVPFENGM